MRFTRALRGSSNYNVIITTFVVCPVVSLIDDDVDGGGQCGYPLIFTRRAAHWHCHESCPLDSSALSVILAGGGPRSSAARSCPSERRRNSFRDIGRCTCWGLRALPIASWTLFVCEFTSSWTSVLRIFLINFPGSLWLNFTSSSSSSSLQHCSPGSAHLTDSQIIIIDDRSLNPLRARRTR